MFAQRFEFWRRTRGIVIGLSVLAACLLLGVWWLQRSGNHPGSAAHSNAAHPAAEPIAEKSGEVAIPRESWSAAGIELAPARRQALEVITELTGKIGLNEDRIAHLYPLVEGRVDLVSVHLGEQVKTGEELVVVQSKEVGQAKLQLYEDRLRRDFARVKDLWTQTVAANTLALIELIRKGATIEEIERQLTNKPIGGYRDQLMTAYSNVYKSQKTVARLSPLAKEMVVAGKQILEAETEHNTSRAALQSLIEQIGKDAEQAAKVSAQEVKELETRVSVDEANLHILGFSGAELEDLNPAKQGEAISHYIISAPFDGTIISKDVVLLEAVRTDRQILSIADLSTVWVMADIYEEQLPLVQGLKGTSIQLRSQAWPGKTFRAEIFYTGDVVNETSRTVALRAAADNSSGLLKPGMFVSIQLPSTLPDVLQIPLTAVQEHEGKQFVFVHLEGDRFVRRDIKLGIRNAESVEVAEGLKPEEMVVAQGAFALKSRLLADLLAE